MSDYIAPEVGSVWLFEGVPVKVERVLQKRYAQITFRWPDVSGDCDLPRTKSVGQTEWAAKAERVGS